jgi:thiol-disulfide isomerase/thioredoxin
MLDGKIFPLNKLLGEGKPVVIDLWATWCGPCRQEIPHLLELSKQYRKAGLIMVGLTVEDPETDRAEVKKFVKELAMTYPVAFAPKGLYLLINGGSTSYRIPQTLVFGADGRIIKRLIGYNEKIGKEILMKAVEQAVAGN